MNTSPSRAARLTSLATAAITLLLTVPAAQAVDWTGYFRTGPGLTSADASRACYSLGGGSKGMTYRLGNECDFYGEFQLSQGFKVDGIETRVTLMTNHYTGATDTDGRGLGIEQMFAEAKGFDVAPEATFWIGKERGRRGDVHIVDTFFVEMAGVGAGFKGQPAGPGKLGVAFYKTDGDSNRPGNRLNVEYLGLPAGADGKLNVFFTATQGDFAGGKSGTGLTLRHDQDKLFGTGLSNTLFVQFAQGSTALNANFGDLTAGSRAKSWRVVQSLTGQSGAIGGQSMLLLASETNAAGVQTDSASVGGRVSFAMTKHFKLIGDIGYSQFKTENAPTAKLLKTTLAAALSTGPDFWTRPEFRLYVTTAKWNSAAGNPTGQAALAGKTSNTSAGAQVEWWF
jgi:maltoporin